MRHQEPGFFPGASYFQIVAAEASLVYQSTNIYDRILSSLPIRTKSRLLRFD
jgi:hypothetical protein